MIGHNQPPAAISGCYADFKLVKTREVCQLVIEVPLDQGPAVVEAFGLPNFGAPIRLAVARILPEGQTPAPPSDTPAPGKRRWRDVPASKQAGIRCGERPFQEWAARTPFPNGAPIAGDGPPFSPEAAATFVRIWCGVKSRADLDTDREARAKWLRLDEQYLRDTGREAEPR